MVRTKDLPRIKLFAQLNGLAYNRPEIAEPEFKKLGYRNLFFINVEGIQAYVLKNENEVVFVIRGTDERKDTLADINIFMKNTQGVYVHAGFEKKANALYNFIKNNAFITSECLKCPQIYYTGHSYGAALALLLSTKQYCNEVITFGCPRVGNKSFVHLTKDIKHFRVRNNMDIVTKIPYWILGYRHHGELVYLDYFGNIVDNPSIWKLFKDTVRSRVKAWSKKQWWDGFYDHYTKEYIEKLNRY